MPTAYAKVWANGGDEEIHNGCPNNTGNCAGWVYHSTRVAKKWPHKTKYRMRCAKICGGRIQYTPGQNRHPCRSGNNANTISAIHKNEGITDGAHGTVACGWNKVTDSTLRSMSKNSVLTSAGLKDYKGRFMSIYEQLLWGFKRGRHNSGTGYCQRVENLHKDVGGGTCYDKLVKKAGAAVAKQKGIQYCKKFPKDKKCACINVTKPNFISYCKKNPTLPGCKELIKGIEDFEKAGLKSATGLFGNADCIVPGVCSGDVYEPLTNLQACANKTAICNQVLSMDNIQAAAGIKAAQACNIDFAAEQKKKDAQKKEAEEAIKAVKTPDGKKLKPGPVPGEVPGKESVVPKLPGGITTVQAGIGGGLLSSLLSFSCLLVIIIVVMSGSRRRR